MKWITIVFIVLLILIVIVANLGLGPSFFPFIYQIPGGDKLGHFFLMGILSFLVNIILKTKKIRIFSINFLLGILIVMAIVTIEELSQIFLDYRVFSIIDLVTDYFGIVLFGYLADYSLNHQRNQKSPGRIE
ncbi:MAG: VanZ family protein [Anaerolineales bacterium]